MEHIGKGKYSMESLNSSIIVILKKLNVDTLFVIPGSLMEILYDIHNDGSFKIISAYHEEQLGYMAMGYYNATGKIPVIMVSQGPGETNLITSIATANREQIPMLIISSFQNDKSKLYFQQNTGDFHNPDVFSLMIGVCDLCWRIEKFLNDLEINHITNTIKKCSSPIYIAVNTSSARGVGIIQEYINIPNELKNENISSIIDNAVKKEIETAFLIGAGVGDSTFRLIAELQKYDCPIFYTIKAMDRFNNNYKNVMGRIGKMGNTDCNIYLSEKCNQLIVFGASLNSNTIAKWFKKFIIRNGKLIHIGIEDTPVCDTKQFYYYKFDKNSFNGIPLLGTSKSIHTTPLTRILHSGNESKTFVFEAYNSTFVPYFNTQKDEKFLMCVGFGPLGSCISMATGASIGDNKRLYIVTCGDGGWLFSGFTLLNLSKLKLPILVIININKEYRTVADGQRKRISRSIATDLFLPNLKSTGDFFYIETAFADTIQDFEKAYSKFRSNKQPMILFIKDEIYEVKDKGE